MSHAQTLHSDVTGPLGQFINDSDEKISLPTYTIPIIGSLIYRICRISSGHNLLFLAPLLRSCWTLELPRRKTAGLLGLNVGFKVTARTSSGAGHVSTHLSSLLPGTTILPLGSRTSPACLPLTPTKVDLIDDNVDLVSTSG